MGILRLFSKKRTRAEYNRKFGKERFHLVGVTNTKMAAEHEADRIRQRGRKARVLPIAHGYAVYQG